MTWLDFGKICTIFVQIGPSLSYRTSAACHLEDALASRWALRCLKFKQSPTVLAIHDIKVRLPCPKKLMQGLPLSGGAIRLAAVSEVLGIAEGIETALAVSEMFGVPVWSCVSAQGIESFEPPEGVREVIVFADNDPNFAGQKAAFAAAHRLKIKGFEVEVCIPPEPGDWLDELLRRQKHDIT